MAIKKVAVVGGGGTMGSGIVQACAQMGLEVSLIEIKEEFAVNGKAKIEKLVNKKIAKGKMTETDAKAMMDLITPKVGYEQAADADLVIEAVFENMDLKKEIFGKLSEVTRPEVVLCTNTSALSVTAIAAATNKPDKVVGMHFFNPAAVMKLVEIVMGLTTSEETYQIAYDFCKQIGKTSVRAKDTPGFLVNWLQIPLLNLAVWSLENGLASAEDIDNAMLFGCNHPIGPLALLDMIGLDNALDVFNVMYEQTGDMRYRPATLHKRMVMAGKLGRKSGEGFFKYNK